MWSCHISICFYYCEYQQAHYITSCFLLKLYCLPCHTHRLLSGIGVSGSSQVCLRLPRLSVHIQSALTMPLRSVRLIIADIIATTGCLHGLLGIWRRSRVFRTRRLSLLVRNGVILARLDFMQNSETFGEQQPQIASRIDK